MTATSLATADFPFMTFRRIDIGMIPAWVGRMTYTGDLGYEIWVAPEYQRALFDLLWEAGQPHGIALFGFRALMSLRMEKMFGTWFREYRPIYTPLEAGMDRYLKLDHDFIGRAAVEAELARGPERPLVYLDVDPDPDEPADVIGDEPIWHDGAGGRLGDVRRLRPLQPAARWRSATCRPRSPCPARRSRSRSSATAVRPACSTEPVLDPAGRADARLMGRPSRRRATPASCSTTSSPTSPSTASPDVSLRPMARALGVSVNAPRAPLRHARTSWWSPHCAGPPRCRRRSQARWLRRQPELVAGRAAAALVAVDQRLAGATWPLVRLGIEAAALDATVSGLPGDVRADQIALWRENIEQRLIAEGMDPAGGDVEASLVKAMFTGLVVDLLATGERRRLTRSLEAGVARLERQLEFAHPSV